MSFPGVQGVPKYKKREPQCTCKVDMPMRCACSPGIDIVQTQIKIAQGYSLPELGLTQVCAIIDSFLSLSIAADVACMWPVKRR